MVPQNQRTKRTARNDRAKRDVTAVTATLPDAALARIVDRLCEYFSDVHTHWDDPDEPLTVSLWTLHTWFIRQYEYRYNFTVYLYVASHGPDCGKTELAKAIIATCNGARGVIPTVAQIKRYLAVAGNRVMVIDQFHNLARAKSVDKEMLDGILNNGHSPGFSINDTALDGTPLYYDTFYPKAFFGITSYQPTPEVLSRCIRITAHPATLDDTRELSKRQTLRPPDVNAREINRMISEWLTDITTRELDQRMTDMGKVIRLNDGEIFNREADNWRMMFALADMAGLDYGKRIRDYAAKLTNSHTEVSQADETEAARIDGLILKLARTGRLPVENWKEPGKTPINDHPDVIVRASDFGWPRDSRYGKDKRLPAVALLFNPGKREAELRIRTTEMDEIAGALGMTRGDIIRTYRNANRLHAQKGRNYISLPFYSGQKQPTAVFAIDFSPVVFGIEYGTTDPGVRTAERILAASTVDELNRVMEA